MNEQLINIITRLADELESEINAKYPPYMMHYPMNQLRRTNDMETIVEARKILNELAIDKPVDDV